MTPKCYKFTSYAFICLVLAMSVLPLASPCSVGVYGCQQSGKTYFVKQLLIHRDDMFTEQTTKILYCYTISQPVLEEMEQSIDIFVMKRGLPSEEDIEELTQNRTHTILVLDDLMSEVCNSPQAEQLFTIHCHHRNMSIIYLSQNIYYNGKKSKTISLQMHYITLFRNPRDKSQISTLARQLFPGKTKNFLEVYNDALEEPYSYLLLDISPHSNQLYQIRSKIFPKEDTIVYRLT